jgi:signal transduction histidine kinase
MKSRKPGHGLINICELMETGNSNVINQKIEQILRLNLKLIKPNVSIPDNISGNQEQLDIILTGLNTIAQELEAKSLFIEERSKRLNALVDLLLKYTLMDFSQQITLSEKGDELDAIALGLNTLGEELDSHISQLKEKTEDLQRSNKQLEQFVYIASHDLQEPLRTISNYLSLFQVDYKQYLDNNSGKYLEVINKATERMQLLITDLLEYARVGQERNVIAINCNLLLNDVLNDMAISIEESNASIELGQLPVVSGNYSELKSLFQNLLSNAIKFKKTEGPLIISIKAEENNFEWIFAIQDNGIGIEQQYQERIFSIFQRLHSKKRYPGTGIGLARCKKIIETHRGKIWVESEQEAGSTFYFTIPKTIGK